MTLRRLTAPPPGKSLSVKCPGVLGSSLRRCRLWKPALVAGHRNTEDLAIYVGTGLTCLWKYRPCPSYTSGPETYGSAHTLPTRVSHPKEEFHSLPGLIWKIFTTVIKKSSKWSELHLVLVLVLVHEKLLFNIGTVTLFRLAQVVISLGLVIVGAYGVRGHH